MSNIARFIELLQRMSNDNVLNTSFNENEPIVMRPEEALNCLLRTNMDILFIGNFLVEKK